MMNHVDKHFGSANFQDVGEGKNEKFAWIFIKYMNRACDFLESPFFIAELGKADLFVFSCQ